MFRSRILLFLLLSLLPNSFVFAQFAHTDHKQIVDASGKPFLIRGTNLGNWLVPEGYMWLFKDGPQSPSEIRALLLELLGPDESALFWHKYREHYITHDDIAFLHRAGFNTLRVPMHWSLFDSDNAEGFKLLDRLIGWSRDEHLYLILDLHCAPGGQTGTNIDDSVGYPWLFQSNLEQFHLVEIWRRIAKRYHNEPTILGYDLLNEPIPPFPKLDPLVPMLEPLYKQVTSEIRKEDGNHIIFLGGSHWDTDFSIFGKPFDRNLAYTFHKYWTKTTDDSVIYPYLAFRDRYDAPLYMGESGENTDDWIAGFVHTLEKNNIGWTFWPYKKMDSTRGIASIVPPADWPKITEFAKFPRGTGQAEDRIKIRPEQATVNKAFADLLDNLSFAKCRINQGYLKALGMKSEIR